MRRMSEIGGRRLPFLRWSVVRMVLARERMTKQGQVGDGREEALADHVTATAAAGDLADAIRAVDEFCYGRSVMMNVGDEKGEILDAAVRRTQPRRLLELGTYCGYSALRTVRTMPASANIVQPAQRGDRIAHPAPRRMPRRPGHHRRRHARRRRCDARHPRARARLRGGCARLRLPRPRQGRLSARPRADRRARVAAARRRGRRRQREGPRRAGVSRPHARPRGREWRTVEHETHLEYQTLVKDLVLESEYVG